MGGGGKRREVGGGGEANGEGPYGRRVGREEQQLALLVNDVDEGDEAAEAVLVVAAQDLRTQGGRTADAERRMSVGQGGDRADAEPVRRGCRATTQRTHSGHTADTARAVLSGGREG